MKQKIFTNAMEDSSSIFIYIYISRTNVYPQNLYFPLRQ